MSTPVRGYGATHHTPLAGLGLGNPEMRRTADHTLSSPRRISTTPRIASPAFADLQNFPTHQAYYSHSQPESASTARFRGEARHTHSLSAHFAIPEMLNASSMTSGHHRHPSATPMTKSPKSPTGSVLRRLRKSASSMGFHLGGSMDYEPDAAKGGLEEEVEDVHDEMRANGLRVWPGCASGLHIRVPLS